MAVTKEVYTASPTWTAAQLATLFKDAFIDAGLIATDWYDSFLNTVENRVLEVSYDGAKTYGKTYYWFQFTTTGVFLQIASGWNATTHVPTGSQYIDYYATTTNATTNHLQLVTLVATTQIDVVRYTSGANTDFSWFLIRNGSTYANLHIPHPNVDIATWIDLDKVMFHHALSCGVSTTNNYAVMDFTNRLCLRRSFWGGGALRGNTTVANFRDNWTFTTQRYFVWGNASSASATTNWASGTTTAPAIILPTGFTNTNPAESTNRTPVFTGLPYSLYTTTPFPSDFGLSGVFLASGMTPLDRLVVSSGVEEWEIVAVANNATVSNDTASPVFVARAV